MPQSDASLIVAGPGRYRLRASFVQHANRFVGHVSLDDDKGILDLLHEVAAEQQPWPPSPPWQGLHIHEESTGSRVLLLVGRAGASHWSMAVSSDDARRAVLFDVACRVRAHPDFLGSTYQYNESLIARRNQADGVIELLSASDGRPAILFEPLAIAGQRAPLVELRAGQIVVRPDYDARPNTTIRWKYCLRFAN